MKYLKLWSQYIWVIFKKGHLLNIREFKDSLYQHLPALTKDVEKKWDLNIRELSDLWEGRNDMKETGETTNKK